MISRDLITSENTRITAAEGALSELAADPANDGRDIVFTVKLGNKKVVKSAKVSVNGGVEKSVTFVSEGSDEFFLAEMADISAGDNVKIRAEIKPGMADRYAPGTTELTVVAA